MGIMFGQYHTELDLKEGGAEEPKAQLRLSIGMESLGS